MKRPAPKPRPSKAGNRVRDLPEDQPSTEDQPRIEGQPRIVSPEEKQEEKEQKEVQQGAKTLEEQGIKSPPLNSKSQAA